MLKRREFVKTLSAAGAAMLLRPDSPLYAHAPEAADPAVRRVLVMFKCHFDAGFIDTQANVVKKYFTQYFPQAIETARAANTAAKRRYVWTTGSWLLFEYLEQASPADRKIMEEAIVRGDIAWHALPFNWQTELLSPSMIEGSLALSKSLDRRFDRVTTGAKMTDVPGHTRGLIAPLARHGIGFLDIGVNDASCPAEVPPIFLWKDPSGATLPVMYHLGYGGITRVPGSDVALAICVRGDNSGPHTAKEIADIYDNLAARFPSAAIAACSLADIADAIQPYRGSLPVVTAEIGDTWIYGVSSDPLKLARFRELSRMREAWIEQGAFRTGDQTDVALLRRILLEAEHTWGTDTKTWLDYDHQLPADLERMLETKNYKVVQFSWAEKRQDLFDGIATLPADLRSQAERAVERLNPSKPTPSAGAKLQSAGERIETPHFLLGINSETGAINQLRNKTTGREWAGPANPIALLTYQTLSQEDYARFMAAYLQSRNAWALKDFGKPNCERFGATSQEWHPTPSAIHLEETSDAHRILVELQFHDDQALRSGRASFPLNNSIELVLPKAAPVLHLEISWFQKPATRLPEALWLTFNPIDTSADGWMLHKCGQTVSPFDVAIGGNRRMHAVSDGFAYRDPAVLDHVFEVETVDAPVIALGSRTPLGFSREQPDLATGVHSNLFNNAWGTNYIMWYGENARLRYRLHA